MDCSDSSNPSSEPFLSSRLSSPFGVESIDGEISPASGTSRFLLSPFCWPRMGVRPSTNFNLASFCTCRIVSMDFSNIISSIRPIFNKTFPHTSIGVTPQTDSTGLPFSSISSTSPSIPISLSVPKNCTNDKNQAHGQSSQFKYSALTSFISSIRKKNLHITYLVRVIQYQDLGKSFPL